MTSGDLLVASGRGGINVPPDTIEGTPDFGRREDWSEWGEGLQPDAVLDALARTVAVLGHPGGQVDDAQVLTETLAPDSWRPPAKNKIDALAGLFPTRLRLLPEDILTFPPPHTDE